MAKRNISKESSYRLLQKLRDRLGDATLVHHDGPALYVELTEDCHVILADNGQQTLLVRNDVEPEAFRLPIPEEIQREFVSLFEQEYAQILESALRNELGWK